MSAKEVRLGSIFDPRDGKSVIIPIDHGFYMGSVEGLERPIEVAKVLVEEHVDATLMSHGLGKACASLFVGTCVPAKILTADYVLMSRIPGEVEGVLGYSAYSSVEQAIRWGFSAVKVLMPWGFDATDQMRIVATIGRIAVECDNKEMPLMIEPVLMGPAAPKDKKDDPKTIAHACRIAVECGADIVKCAYTGDVDSFHDIVDSIGVPVVILGGPKMGAVDQVLATARDSIRAGGKGIVFGRNVWQYPAMRSLVRALKEIVHGGAEVDVVMEKYNLK